MPVINNNPTRQERRTKRKANTRKMRVHGRGMKRNLPGNKKTASKRS